MKTKISLEEIYSPIDASLQQIPSVILDILSTPNDLAKDVIEYFFSAKGKLLRPALTLLGADMMRVQSDAGFAVAGGSRPSLNRAGSLASENAQVLQLAASFEIFHAATLIHDDIIDAAYLRRNLPTINTKWNSQVAVLVGDYLHDKAIGSVFKNGNEKIVSIFLETAGTVCDGEIHELNERQNFQLTEDEYIQIVDKKTAALLACCVQNGALRAGMKERESESLKRFGRYFGIAFQIIDDCLDFTGQEDEFGKTLGADLAAGVLTLPLIHLTDTADETKRAEILTIFKSGGSPEAYQPLLQMMKDHGSIDYALAKAREYCDKAGAELEPFPDSPAKQSLHKLLDYVLERNK